MDKDRIQTVKGHNKDIAFDMAFLSFLHDTMIYFGMIKG